jgi:ribose transport system permease protein
MLSEEIVSDASHEDPRTGAHTRTTTRRVMAALSFRNVSALYVGLGFFVLFAIWIPDLFLTSTTWKSLLNQQAISAMVAVGLVLPLAAGVFDLSIGSAVGVGEMLAAWLIGDKHVAIGLAIALSVLSGTGIGIINAFLVTRLRIDSFIATLGTTSCLAALVTAVSGGNQIIGLPAGFQDITTTELLGVTLPVYGLVILSILIWHLLEHTPAGRYVYATGGNPDAARLTGVSTRTVVTLCLIAGSTIAAFAGVLVASSAGGASPGDGAAYLLPAFSAAFLGSTQIRNGQFNVWGTVLAVYVLALGVQGLELAGAPVWLPDLFNGIALLVAVGLAKTGFGADRRKGASSLWRLLGRTRMAVSEPPIGPKEPSA